MKALTICQPWASLIAISAKKVETRSWHTSYRGSLAIHAAKGYPRDARDFGTYIRMSVLFGPHYQYPRGVVIATCRLADCLPMQSLGCLSDVFEDYPDLDTEHTRMAVSIGTVVAE